MNDLFLELLNRSIAAGWLILAVILLRLLLKKAPKWISCLLWGLAAFRLLCPFSLESIFSVIPSRETVRPEIVYSPSPSIDSGITAVDHLVNPVLQQSFSPEAGDSVNPLQVVLAVAAVIWLLGLLGMILYALAGYIRLRLRVRTAVRLTEPDYVSELVDSPFILGIFKPRIYLPSGMSEELQAAVLAHEHAHLKRLDPLWKLLGYGLLAVYWFHPLCWAAWLLFCRDIELACDEKVIRDLAPGQKKAYSEALLFCSLSQGHMTAACPLAFGEVGVKERIRSVLNYKRPAFWIIATALAACVIVGVCFLTDPVKERPDEIGATTGNPGEAGQGKDGSPDGDSGEAEGEKDSSPIGNSDDAGQEEDSRARRLNSFLRQWTEAFVNRNGETIASLASAETITDLKDRELLHGSAGSYSFGESSPWPLDPAADVWIYEQEENMAEIYYYAWTSDRYATVWKEWLYYEDQGGDYTVTGEQLTWYDKIATAEQYRTAYPYLNGTRMDYLTNGAGQWLTEHAPFDSSMLYKPLYEPESAAVRLLNLSEDPSEVTIERLWEDGDMVGLKLTFLQGEKYSFQIDMALMNDMIWVPQNYYLDPVFWLQKIDWNAVKRKGLSVGDRLSEEGVRCIARIPEEEIALYGADSSECTFGVMVEMGQERFFYNWYYCTPRDVLPECFWDKSNQRLLTALNLYTGTGADAWELHVLKYHDGMLTDNLLSINDYSGLLFERISFTFDSETSLLTLQDGKNGTELATQQVDWPVRELELGNISRFLLGEKLSLQVETGYFTGENYGGAEYDNMPVLNVEILMKETGDGDILFELGEIRVAEDL